MYGQDGNYEGSSKSKGVFGSDQQPYFGGENRGGTGNKRHNQSSQDNDDNRSLSDEREDYNENNTVKKRDTHKIRTNPKYRCVDDGSDDDADEVKHEEYQ